jgi:replicative DNA helicase
MGSRELTQQFLCSRAKANLQRIRNGFLSERDFPMLLTAASNLATSNIMIDDTAELLIGELREQAKENAARVPTVPPSAAKGISSFFWTLSPRESIQV